MLLVDVNVLVYAYWDDAPRFAHIRPWLHEVVKADQSYGLTDVVLSGFLRIVTHPRIFTTPAPLDEAIAFVEALRNQTHCVIVSPGPRHWSIFLDLCRTAGVRGNLLPDAYLAALAIESGSEWITTDRDYARFPGLRWREPG
jgi:uncharacterized protein